MWVFWILAVCLFALRSREKRREYDTCWVHEVRQHRHFVISWSKDNSLFLTLTHIIIWHSMSYWLCTAWPSYNWVNLTSYVLWQDKPARPPIPLSNSLGNQIGCFGVQESCIPTTGFPAASSIKGNSLTFPYSFSLTIPVQGLVWKFPLGCQIFQYVTLSEKVIYQLV